MTSTNPAAETSRATARRRARLGSDRHLQRQRRHEHRRRQPHRRARRHPGRHPDGHHGLLPHRRGLHDRRRPHRRYHRAAAHHAHRAGPGRPGRGRGSLRFSHRSAHLGRPGAHGGRGVSGDPLGARTGGGPLRGEAARGGLRGHCRRGGPVHPLPHLLRRHHGRRGLPRHLRRAGRLFRPRSGDDRAAARKCPAGGAPSPWRASRRRGPSWQQDCCCSPFSFPSSGRPRQPAEPSSHDPTSPRRRCARDFSPWRCRSSSWAPRESSSLPT